MPDDLDEFARLWREEPSAEESRALKQLAGQTARRAKLLGYAEIGAATVIGLAILFALVLNRTTVTVLSGGILLLALSWSSWKRYLLRQVAIIVSAGDGEALVEKEIAKARADLRRIKIGLLLYPPAVLLGHLLVDSVVRGGRSEDYLEVLANDLTDWPVGALLVLLFVCFLLYQLRAMAGLRKELRRLDGIREEYREEGRLDSLDPDRLTH